MGKRAVDVVGGTFLALLAMPAILVLALGCALSLRAWPFFVQRRVGRDGRTFPLPKLRTLPRHTPSSVDKYALQHTRVPPFCRVLRRLHIDELPQLLVVPLGWMSLVGPRPEMMTMMARYPNAFAVARMRVRPGCTGLWQISRASGQMIYEAPEYDMYYVENRGVRLDVWIMYRTVRMWLGSRSTVVLADVPRWTKRRIAAVEPDAFIDLREHLPEPIVVLPPPIDLRAARPADELEAME